MRVCVTPISPQISKLDLNVKSNLQVHFGSKAMASLYHLLCYNSLTSTDPLLEELLYLPVRFHSHIFNYIAYDHSSDEESVHSIDSSVSAFYFDDSTYFSLIFYTLLVYFFYATPKFSYHEDGHSTYKRAAGRERPTTQKKARRP